MTNKTTFDAIIIGGGHNGLSAAATLAKKGKTVCVIEKSDRLGGMLAEREITPGVTAPGMAHLLYNLNKTVARELGIDGHSVLPTKTIPTVSLSPDGAHVVIRGGKASTVDGKPHDKAAEFERLHARLVRVSGILGKLSTKSPPKLADGLTNPATLLELTNLARLGLDLKLLGKTEMREFLRIMLSNIHDLALDELGDTPLAGVLAADAVRGAYAGPRSPGTVFSLMYRYGNGGDIQLPLGGMSSVVSAFEKAAKDAGCVIRCGQAVTAVSVEGDQVTGVTLADGTSLKAKAVLSNTGPLQTMKMAGVAHFDIEQARRLKSMRCKGTVAKLNLMLSEAPAFTGLPADLQQARLVIAPSSTYVERAFNPAKYGEMPTSPTIEMVLVPASNGQMVLSAIVNFVPPTPKGGWTDAAKTDLTQRVLAVIESYAPGLSELVKGSELLSPADIEAATGAPGGHWHHAEMGFDQILTVRPANGMAHYAFGPRGLYLCGASAHPGGDITGAPGRNSARQLLKDGVL